MVVEEPDIEIGQGVSSKAISRRMQTDKGGNNGPKSSRDREEEEQSRYRRRDDDYSDRSAPVNTAMPSFPGFPYPLPGMPNGMPMSMFPPGFAYPGQGAPGQQPGPPGR
jgi:protein NRD1